MPYSVSYEMIISNTLREQEYLQSIWVRDNSDFWDNGLGNFTDKEQRFFNVRDLDWDKSVHTSLTGSLCSGNRALEKWIRKSS